MSKKKAYYIDLSRTVEPERPPFHWLRFLLLLLLALVLLLAGFYIIAVRRPEQKAAALLPAFRQAEAEADYSRMADLYDQAQLGSSQKTWPRDFRDRYQAIVLSMESEVDERLQTILADWTSGTADISQDDLNFLNGIGALSVNAVKNAGTEQLQALLNGQESAAQTRQSLENLLQVEQTRATLQTYLDAVAPIVQLQEAYAQIVQQGQDGQYTEALDQLEELLAGETAQSSAYVLELLRTEETSLKSDMHTYYVSYLNKLIEHKRYVSAESTLEELDSYFENDSDLQSIAETVKENLPTGLVTYAGNVENLTVKPLIVDTSRAFQSNDVGSTTESSMLTTTEFANLLQQLYENNYVLVDLQYLMDDSGEARQLELPEGKQPFVLTLENFNYTPTRRVYGNNSNLVLNDQGQVCGEYVGIDGKPVVARDNEAIGILEAFVETHPDFSFDGAMGTISVSGAYGVFGYVLNQRQLDAYNSFATEYNIPGLSLSDADFTNNQQQCQAIIDTLKENGWTFASQSYSGSSVTDLSLEELESDTESWQTEVGALTGSVNTYSYPYGNNYSGDDERKLYLQNQGFTFFLGYGDEAYSAVSQNYYYMSRLVLSGAQMRAGSLDRLVDVSKIYDSNRPYPLTTAASD
ncbi:MAG: hypothetical protein PHR21_03585 [Oscillospiraceae bacterium]|nr:hypothetical protein [Oscillospiraceae bacterium]MDD4368350.1 hypothetical protein [Oscillospiraceae bacterium]